jgi:hypothetical protein
MSPISTTSLSWGSVCIGSDYIRYVAGARNQDKIPLIATRNIKRGHRFPLFYLCHLKKGF